MTIAYLKGQHEDVSQKGEKGFTVRVKALVNTNTPTIAQKASKAVLKVFRTIRNPEKKIVAMEVKLTILGFNTMINFTDMLPTVRAIRDALEKGGMPVNGLYASYEKTTGTSPEWVFEVHFREIDPVEDTKGRGLQQYEIREINQCQQQRKTKQSTNNSWWLCHGLTGTCHPTQECFGKQSIKSATKHETWLGC